MGSLFFSMSDEHVRRACPTFVADSASDLHMPPLTRALGSEYIPSFWGFRGNDAHSTACGDSSLSARWTRHAGSDRTLFVQSLLRPRYHRLPFCPHRA